MTFFVTKALATGPIRFGVASRCALDAIDDDPAFSTGPEGGFTRRRRESFFFADSRNAPGTPSFPGRHAEQTWVEQILALPKPLLALVPLGVIFIFLGFAVLVSKGASGWVEIIFGLAMLAVPIILTAQQRKQERERLERERAVREERERRDRELLASYTAALDRMRENPNEETMDAVGRERAAIDLPDAVWSPAARLTVLQIGLEALHRLGASKSDEVAHLMSETASAAGLHRDARIALLEDFYLIILWHLLADDRLGPTQTAQLELLRRGLGVDVTDQAVEQFERLRGIGVRNLPRIECNVRLGFHEYCIHAAKNLALTNKRLMLPSQKPSEVALSKIDDVAVDADTQTVTIRVAGIKKPLSLALDDPIFTASLIDMASSLNERPRGFA